MPALARLCRRCIERSSASDEIVETISESLVLKQTPIPKKLARLFLVSDLLHNSSAGVPRAGTYRTRFQTTLVGIFEAFHATYASLESRMSQESLRDVVIKVLHIWQACARSLFSPLLDRDHYYR